MVNPRNNGLNVREVAPDVLEYRPRVYLVEPLDGNEAVEVTDRSQVKITKEIGSDLGAKAFTLNRRQHLPFGEIGFAQLRFGHSRLIRVSCWDAVYLHRLRVVKAAAFGNFANPVPRVLNGSWRVVLTR
jgi:hypothetical protein